MDTHKSFVLAAQNIDALLKAIDLRREVSDFLLQVRLSLLSLLVILTASPGLQNEKSKITSFADKPFSHGRILIIG